MRKCMNPTMSKYLAAYTKIKNQKTKNPKKHPNATLIYFLIVPKIFDTKILPHISI